MAAVTPEGRVKKAVKLVLAEFDPPPYTHWPVPSGYGDSTLDCVGCWNGRFFAIETKAPGEKLTPRQLETARRIHAAGGVVFVIRDDVGLRLLRAWLREGWMGS